MRKRHALPALFLAGLIAGATLLGADSRGRQPNRSAAQPADSIVTPVVGPSWLNHLKLNFSDSSLGRGAGRYGPTPTEPQTVTPGSTSFVAGQSNVITGADLYRLNCQACHRAEGTGSPPDIKSLLSLVRDRLLSWFGDSFTARTRPRPPESGSKSPKRAASSIGEFERGGSGCRRLRISRKRTSTCFTRISPSSPTRLILRVNLNASRAGADWGSTS